MKLGIALPNAGDHVEPDALIQLATGAEQIGLDSVWVADRWLRPHAPVSVPGVPVPIEMPVASYRTVYDPIDLLTFIAARTERIQLGTSAINTLYHPPVLLARRFATLDRLSGGRVIAGLTQGWMAEEFAVAGVPAEHSGCRFEDHLSAMRQVWSADPVEHHGPYYQIPTSDIGPKPANPAGIPVVIGYATEAGIRRAARIGAGLHPYRNDLDQLRRELDLWRSTVTEQRRNSASLPIVLRASARFNEPETTGESARPLFTGAVDHYLEDLSQLESLGVDHVLLQFSSGISVEQVLETLASVVNARTHGQD